MQKHIRKLQRLGAYSYAVVIPKEIIDRFGWRERQKLLLSFDGK
ncbi:MAG: AbrB/MazE/SpoVT family DNA-binding domain-containing protein, partial [Parcubacteria group bacterium]|nr:AbrB/MazE/SpoVT family DNA-binding domain-containing protein [Parcubacteria group bacterium]